MAGPVHAPDASPDHPVEPAGALVIGSDYAGLGIVRSLGRHSIPVWVIRENGHVTAAVSRYTRRRLDWPNDDEEARIAWLDELAAHHRLDGWTLFPTSDTAAALIARHEAVLGKRFRLTTPSWEAMRWAYDKKLTYELAASLEIDHPLSFHPRSRAEVEALECSFPAVLKPTVKEGSNSFTIARAWRVGDRRQLLDRYDEASALIDPADIIVQELIPGGGESQFSFVALCEGGRPLVWGVARRARQYPPDFGYGSTFVETVDLPQIEEPARRFLAAISYDGLVEMEFKRDPRSGRLKLLDVNPRSWAWHTLAGRAGVDFPYLSWRRANGRDVAEGKARPGVRWVRGTNDLAAAWHEIRNGRLSLRDYFRSIAPPVEYAVFAADDPLPSLVDMPSLLVRLWRRGGASAWRHSMAMIGRGRRDLAPSLR
jgi:D-aspartate ligase